MSSQDLQRTRARAVREKLQLGVAPVLDMVDLIEQYVGCDVAVVPMPEGMDGMVVKDTETGRTVVAVATTDALVRQRMTLAHELGHLELDAMTRVVPADCAARTPEEIAADTFARHLLAPSDGVTLLLQQVGAVRGHATEAHLSTVVRHFQVSPAVAAIQMRDEGWTGRDQADAWMREATRRLATRYGWRREYESWAVEASQERPPRRLMQRVIDAYVEGVVPVSAVAQVAGVTVDVAQRQLDEDGVAPREVEIAWLDLGADDT